ncbi:TPA: hypothetical protein HA241_03100 [Candidatus Woesearchaeota archaeon]|nr:hypothetical protein [Candidatus Woesearchaeota archaeon]
MLKTVSFFKYLLPFLNEKPNRRKRRGIKEIVWVFRPENISPIFTQSPQGDGVCFPKSTLPKPLYINLLSFNEDNEQKKEAVLGCFLSLLSEGR